MKNPKKSSFRFVFMAPLRWSDGADPPVVRSSLKRVTGDHCTLHWRHTVKELAAYALGEEGYGSESVVGATNKAFPASMVS